MDCPRCGAGPVAGQPGCTRCGFSLSALMAAFGLDLIELKRLNDEAHSLRLHEAQEVEAALIEFEEHFPQVFFSVYLGVLPQPLSVNELAFLLLNRGVFWAEYHPRLNEHAIALVLDPETRSVGLMTGYALEASLPPRVLRRILRAVRTALWHAEYAPAILEVVRQISAALRKRATRAWRRDVLPPAPPDDFLGGSGVRPLQGGGGPGSNMMEEKSSGQFLP